MSRGVLAAIAGGVAVALASGCSTSCRGKGDVEVQGVLIPQADGFVEAAPGPTVTLIAGQRADEVELPPTDGPVIRVAIGREASYGQAKALIKRIEAAGKRPVVLVGKRYKLKAIELNDELRNPRTAIRLVATPDGEACVAPPDNPESKCVVQALSDHVSTAYVREFVREAVRTYGLDEVRIFVRPSVEWADVIRSIDGARTCCDELRPKVRLADWNGEDIE